MHIRFVNCPSLLQRPAFQFPLYVLKDKETSADSLHLLRWYSDKITEILNVGIQVSFANFDESFMIKVPKTQIPLNGEFLIRFGTNMFAADAKARGSNECLTLLETIAHECVELSLSQDMATSTIAITGRGRSAETPRQSNWT